MTTNALESATRLIKEATDIVVFTGAGVSAESGISTFRDPATGALWSKFDPEKLVTMNGFDENPRLVWEWHDMLHEKVTVAEPNQAHKWIAELEKHADVTVVTQNVDDLHERAGSTKVVHLHGDLRARCTICSWREPKVTAWQARDLSLLPWCPECNAPARPNSTWFGELLPERAVIQAKEALGWCDLCLIVGTSAQVYPAAEMPMAVVKRGMPVISVNTRAEDHFFKSSVNLTGKAGEVLAGITLETS